jgi:hypothetical protein
MAFTFSIVFSGLCAFSPNRPFDPEPGRLGAYVPPDQVLVLLPKLLQPVKILEGKEILDAHLPTLEFNSDLLINGAKNRPDYYQLDPTSVTEEDKDFCLLLDQDLSLVVDKNKGSASGLIVKNGIPNDLSKPTIGKDEDYLWWLTKIDKVAKKPLKLDPALAKNLPPGNKVIVSRLNLAAGLLRVTKLTEGQFGYKPLGKSGQYYYGANRVAIELTLDISFSSEVEIVFKEFMGAERSLVFGPPPKGSVVRVHVKNREVHDLIEQIPKGKHSKNYDPDFAIYYQLVKKTSKPLKPVLPFRDGGGASGYGKPCSPCGINRD